ncbi:FKBP-type peptidyl-prolyl cis-trans isomerase [Dactylosporangium matsuzakiense]|uniref:Peptidyl-prolyl cis-trans isomerase n=1 Tax=Dactylosporangium matsuzakiense TaxID=53360 RepID=A0A9W6KFU6_9ACTN|nr:FKBP-type peptidyl-prolyl cis-trans isomerase [Dactylosporangium matsuzakiense]UWZ45865.1 hypothetical protein Dmats_05110 [Dactylosporangium matsuzakiense]GLL00082.1 hypothetical protein GCM10017581_018220 [Dactylosporangium matsuzakiense]
MIRLPDLDTLVVPVAPDAAEAMAAALVEQLRDHFAAHTEVDRPAAAGDTVVLDLVATVGGTPVERGTASGVRHEVGAGHLLAGLDEALPGLRAGDRAVIETRLVGGPDAGRAATLAITVRAVLERGRLSADGVDVPRLRAALHDEVEGARQRLALAGTFAALRAGATLPAPADLPPDRVAAATERRRAELAAAGPLDPADAELEAAIAETVTERVLAELLLDAVADALAIDDHNEPRRRARALDAVARRATYVTADA